MTGIERLRELAELRVVENRESVTLRAELRSIADQIDRELDEHARCQLADYLRVRAVERDMERHVLGHEGMEDSPVARWARELREALGGHVEEVADVATIRKDAYDAYEWMCEHGGLDYVMHEWQSRVPRDRYERRRQRLLDHIAECETALGRRNRRIKELGHRVNDLTTENAELRRRAMPDGCEWPCFEDGEPIRFGDWFENDNDGKSVLRKSVLSTVTIRDLRDGRDGCFFWKLGDGPRAVLLKDGERVKRPTPKVLDADGVEIRVGDTVWHVETGERCKVVEVDSRSVSVDFRIDGVGTKHTGSILPANLTHSAPVLAADGRPLREGETVWGTGREEHEYVVLGQPGLGGGAGRFKVTCHDVTDDVDCDCDPDLLTHERPDSWERITEDIASPYCADYCIKYGVDHSGMSFEYAKACDIVRRAKALAGRGA